MGDAGGDDDWYGYCLDDPVNGTDPLGLLKNEYGDEIPEGRIITEYFPGIESVFSAYGTKRKVQAALRKEKAEYTDSNDLAMRGNLEKEAEGFGFLDGVFSAYRHKTDKGAIQYHIQKAKEQIGSK
ncbi:hypothetical protein [Pseudodesulfovibrio cashew]|uniref:hypothetical protein n=1 Tax=Pseudodesulfovibrio cashew TaxID=2678688 RepID=UPI0018EF148C|nr:hypothetical protein [Pseudodesulfovibrio cashew]